MGHTSILNLNTFFKYFIYTPDSKHLTETEQKTVKVACFVISLLTLFVLPFVCRKIWADRKVEILTAAYHTTISKCPDPWKPKQPDSKHIDNAKEIPCHQIINGLFLGNSTAFVQASHQQCQDTSQVVPIPLDTTNPNQFEELVTLCPLNVIVGDYPDLDKADLFQCLTTAFETHRISWNFLGKVLIDDPTGWDSLVFDSTLPNDDLAKINLDSKKGMKKEDLESLLRQKSEKIQKIDVEKLFEPIFEKIDKAVFEGKKMLVHCQAGQSRSPSFLAAYLIKRFDVSSEQALAYLRSKRLCVSSKFAEQLSEYAKALGAKKEKKAID